MPDLPSGTVTFLFTDVEGSTKLLHKLGAGAYADALADHRRVIRDACAAEGGVEVDTQGDAFFFAFPSARGALSAASTFSEELASGPIRARVGLHTGTPLLTDEGYVGDDVHRAARIAASGHGGQVLVSQTSAPLVEAELRDLGEHRFKDLSAAEHVYQLGAEDFPALKSLYRTNLPVPATPFLGRESELAEVAGLLGTTRFLTLTGPGGTGKTRLAAQAAGLASDGYPDGVWWVSLAPLRDARLVLQTVAQAIEAKNGVAAHIGDRAMLVLFDNFEHVTEAAPDLAELLASCPRLGLLVTSREPLHISGEHEYPVPPLAHDEGVDFFLARARAVRPDFQADAAVSEICRRLDDLPLALELAAARTKALSSKQILERLDASLPLLTGGARDLPERQQTLRAAIAWSYDLLSDDEKLLFRRLSVFVGGCTLEAAEAVCEADLDILQSLIDKSLARFTGERYWMLETMREFAAERLEERSEGETVREQHAIWFSGIERGTGYERIERISLDLNNLRAAAAWLKDRGRGVELMQLAGSTWFYFHLRAPEEGRSLVVAALDLSRDASDDRARVLQGMAVFEELRGDLVSAEAYCREALGMNRTLGSWRGERSCLLELGLIASGGGRLDEAQALYEESAAIAEREGSEDGRIDALIALADLALRRDDFPGAESLSRETLPSIDDTTDLTAAIVLNNIVFAAAKQDDRVSATGAARRSLEILGLLGATRDLRNVLEALAHLGAGLDACRAATLLGASEALERGFGGLSTFEASVHDETVELLAQVPEAEWHDCWQRGAQLDAEQALELGFEMCDWLASLV